MYREKLQLLTETALLAAFITVSGAFKLPGLFPGTEFQLSAPVAVAVCGVFGIKKYLSAGILSSMVGLMLGTQNVFNVLIAMIFRVVVAIIYYFCGKNKFFYIFYWSIIFHTSFHNRVSFLFSYSIIYNRM